MWNKDENCCCLGVTDNQIVIGETYTNCSPKKSSNSMKWVSFIETISAEGEKLPSLIIFAGKSCQPTWFPTKDNPNFRYTTSENAWTSNDMSLKLRQIFIPETQNNGQSCLLFLDRHGSHCTIEFMIECKNNNIWPFYLIPHSSHIF